MKAKFIQTIYHYKNHQIIIEPFCKTLCGWAVEFEYAHLFKCHTELCMIDDDYLVNKGINPNREISYFTIDETEETEIYHHNVDMNKPKSILKYLMNCIDEWDD